MGILCYWFWSMVFKKKEKEEDYSWIEMIPNWKRFIPKKKKEVKVEVEEEEEKEGLISYFIYFCVWAGILYYFFDINLFEIVFKILLNPAKEPRSF